MIARPAVIRDEGAVMARDHADPPRSADASAGEIVARPCIAIDQLPLVWAPGIERLFARLAGAIAGCLERKWRGDDLEHIASLEDMVVRLSRIKRRDGRVGASLRLPFRLDDDLDGLLLERGDRDEAGVPDHIPV